MNCNMRLILIDNETEAHAALRRVGCEGNELESFAGNAVTRVVKLEGVPIEAAQLLKQEALDSGTAAVVHSEAGDNAPERGDVLLIGTHCQLRRLAQRLKSKPFGLEQASCELSELLERFEVPVERTLDCAGKPLTLGRRTLIMGILNITPDSFSDGGRFLHSDQAIAQAEKLIEEGADILDIGGESTRPGHIPVDVEEEWARLEPVLDALAPRISIPISVDTYKAEVARRAIACGANIINDIWGLQKDPKMAEVVGSSGVPVVVMHNQQGTAYRSLMGDIMAFLRKSIELAEAHGLRGDQIIVDPGIGFGKTTDHNLEVMSRLEELKSLGRPILLGASRKSMIGNTLNLPVEERLEGTIATSVIGVQAGVDIIRVHDVQANRRAITMAEAIYRKFRGKDYEGA